MRERPTIILPFHIHSHRHTANPIFMGCKSFCGLVRLLIAFKSYPLWSAQIRKWLPKMKSEAVIIKISNSIGELEVRYANANWVVAKCEMKMCVRYDFVPFCLTLHLIFLHSKGYRVKLHWTNACIPHSLWFKTSKSTSLCKNANLFKTAAHTGAKCHRQHCPPRVYHIFGQASEHCWFHFLLLEWGYYRYYFNKNWMKKCIFELCQIRHLKEFTKINQNNDLELRIFHPVYVQLDYTVCSSLPSLNWHIVLHGMSTNCINCVRQAVGSPPINATVLAQLCFQSITEHCLCPINNATDVEYFNPCHAHIPLASFELLVIEWNEYFALKLTYILHLFKTFSTPLKTPIRILARMHACTCACTHTI